MTKTLRGTNSLLASLALLAACESSPPPATGTAPQPGASAAAPIVPGTGRITGGLSDAEVQRTTPGTGVQAPIVPGTGRITGGLSDAEVQRTTPGTGAQAPIIPGTGRITGGLSDAEVQRSGSGAPPAGYPVRR